MASNSGGCATAWREAAWTSGLAPQTTARNSHYLLDAAAAQLAAEPREAAVGTPDGTLASPGGVALTVARAARRLSLRSGASPEHVAEHGAGMSGRFRPGHRHRGERRDSAGPRRPHGRRHAIAHQPPAMPPEPPLQREELRGTWAMAQEANLDAPKGRERAEQAQRHGLPAAASIRDRSLTLFRRGRWAPVPAPGGTFIGVPFLEDMRALGGQDVVFVGAPLDAGTTYRPGTRFGPQALRLASLLGGSYNTGWGIELHEALDMVDAGDIQVIPANLEKSFDQIASAVSYIAERQIFTVVLGGDHAIGYPDIRGLAPYIDGKIGILHFDRHSDLTESMYDERMHGSPFFHATNLPNVPATNLVQIGIGGWTGSKPGMRVARERRATVITIDDLERYGLERVMEHALEVAWKDARAVWLSLDIDVVDPAFAPGTGTPEPGGLLPRELFRMLRLAAREGLAGMEVVEVSPPYDVADLTALLGGRAIMEVLATLVDAGKLGRRPPAAPLGPLELPGAPGPHPPRRRG
jgi:agmatinase